MLKEDTTEFDKGYELGRRNQALELIQQIKRREGIQESEKNYIAAQVERNQAVTALQRICAEYGDTVWDNDLRLVDIITKHLEPYLIKPLEWTMQRPSEPGFYWLRGDTQDEDPRVVEVGEYNAGLKVLTPGSSLTWNFDELCGDEWAGPILSPEEDLEEAERRYNVDNPDEDDDRICGRPDESDGAF